MKIKRTWLLLILFFLSNPAFSLGLGFASVNSYINQPLSAKIAIKHLGQVAPEDIKVYLSSALDFQRFGIEKTYFLRSLIFKVRYEEGQNAYIHISTKNPIKEPLVDFVISVQWPEGNITRDYSLFLNPNPVINKPKVSKVTKNTFSQSMPSASMQSGAELTYDYPHDQTGEYGPTRNGESISMIASRVRPDESYSIQRIMRALYRMNPNAFIAGDINRLRMGQVLKVPPLMRQEFKKSGSPMRYEQAPSQEMPKPESKPEQISLPVSVMQEEQQDSELRLLSSGDQAELDMLEIENPTQEDIDKVSNQLIKITLERVKRLKEENLALRQRFEMLVERMEDAVEKNARLDEQLAALQSSNQDLAEGKEIYKDIDAEVDQTLIDNMASKKEDVKESKDSGDEQAIIGEKQKISSSATKPTEKQQTVSEQDENLKQESQAEQKQAKVEVKSDIQPQEKPTEKGIWESIKEYLSIWYLVIVALIAAIIGGIKYLLPKFKDTGIMDKFSLYRKYKGDSLTVDDDIDDIDLDLFEAKEEPKAEKKETAETKSKPTPQPSKADEIEEVEINNAGTLSAQEDAIDDLDDIFGEPNLDDEHEVEPDHGSSVQNSAVSNDSQINFNDILGTSVTESEDKSNDGVDIISQSSVYFAYGKFDLAEKLILDGLETDPDNKKYKLKLMECYAKMDNEESFLSYLTKVSDLYSGDEEFRTKVQKLYHDRWKKELY